MDSVEDLWTDDELSGAAEEIESALPIVLTGAGGDHDLDLEAVDDVFAQVVSRLSPLEAESLGSALRTVGRWANDRAALGQLASTVLPIAATAVGTAYGGPVGAALGRTVGERAAQAIGGRPAPPRAPGAGAPPDGSPAAAQLLYLVQNPSFLSSLVALALGSQGQSTVPVGAGNQQVPVGAFMNLATSLAGRAAEDADALGGDGESLSDSYLRDATGCLTCDPAVPAQRAEALLKLLQQEEEAACTWSDDLDWESWSDE